MSATWQFSLRKRHTPSLRGLSTLAKVFFGRLRDRFKENITSTRSLAPRWPWWLLWFTPRDRLLCNFELAGLGGNVLSLAGEIKSTCRSFMEDNLFRRRVAVEVSSLTTVSSNSCKAIWLLISKSRTSSPQSHSKYSSSCEGFSEKVSASFSLYIASDLNISSSCLTAKGDSPVSGWQHSTCSIIA